MSRLLLANVYLKGKTPINIYSLSCKINVIKGNELKTYLESIKTTCVETFGTGLLDKNKEMNISYTHKSLKKHPR